jgi:hypothetical protein
MLDIFQRTDKYVPFRVLHRYYYIFFLCNRPVVIFIIYVLVVLWDYKGDGLAETVNTLVNACAVSFFNFVVVI